jgi:alkylation response protein AidB-like acyl-CoA dehydrogenase
VDDTLPWGGSPTGSGTAAALAGRLAGECPLIGGAVGPLARALAAEGLLDLPLPGRGRTPQRLAGLAVLGAADLGLAKVTEPHADAAAILADLGRPGPTDGLWGVWAAEPPDGALRAVPADGSGAPGRWEATWVVSGRKPFCSGAASCDHALVTAVADDGPRLFAVHVSEERDRTGRIRPVPRSWETTAMAGSDSRTLDFAGVPAEPVGPPGGYVDRAGFWHGGAGIAAVWWGALRAVVTTLRRGVAGRGAADPHALAHLGAVSALVDGLGAALRQAAELADRSPCDVPAAREAALRVRWLADRAASEVIDRVGRALGPRPLVSDADHARRVADLMLFTRQTHAELDLEALGRLVLEREW